jgi:hypothetical protein
LFRQPRSIVARSAAVLSTSPSESNSGTANSFSENCGNAVLSTPSVKYRMICVDLLQYVGRVIAIEMTAATNKHQQAQTGMQQAMWASAPAMNSVVLLAVIACD